jgi:D-alanyl-lipoteichoic acid acyltransferase DltB (MBOAT superfamily)
VSGLWHGANWTYIIWGALNGVYLVGGLISAPLIKKINRITRIDKFRGLHTFFQVIITFILVCFAWIFFRANTVSDAFLIIKKIARFKGPVFYEDLSTLGYSFLGIIFLLIVEFKQEYFGKRFLVLNHPHFAIRNLAYAVMVLLIILFGVFDGGQFIYFQF